MSANNFHPDQLGQSIIALPLIKMIKQGEKLEKAATDAGQKANVALVLEIENAAYFPLYLLEFMPRIVISYFSRRAKELVSKASQTLNFHENPANHLHFDEPLIVDGKLVFFFQLPPELIQQMRILAFVEDMEEPRISVHCLPAVFDVIIDLNLEFQNGRKAARRGVEHYLHNIHRELGGPWSKWEPKSNKEQAQDELSSQYIFATLGLKEIQELVRLDFQAGSNDAKSRSIYRIWPDFKVRNCITKSIGTVKANAAINSFSSRGNDMTWAVMDSGIQEDHPHFERWHNLSSHTLHKDFTGKNNPLQDEKGHGTHVAGIIAGEWDSSTNGSSLKAVSRILDEQGNQDTSVTTLEKISGMAPECRLVSLKVLDENGYGSVSTLIKALTYIQEVNGHGRRLIIHGVNISLGYVFDPEWFACGQSPLCVEVDRLVKSGVVVVVAAGNTGYGTINSGKTKAGIGITINDPGNAELAITVGATHRDMPHVYGVSYFSSKGPTGDGRLKPDLVAPGERIISCAADSSKLKQEVAEGTQCNYLETSGTSMAAPHVSGVIAAFLSVRREFIGRPEKVKEIFVSTCTDLGRERYFQGAGLIDLMRAIQSV